MTVLETPLATSRLLGPAARQERMSWAEHVDVYGPLPSVPGPGDNGAERLLAEIESSGLRGRGGAGFPSYRKLGLVHAFDPHPVVVVNAMEGEPASAKDQVLLALSPHLVLDGAELVASMLSASMVVICLPHDRDGLARAVAAAVAERANQARAGVPIEVTRVPGRYVAGEESALVAAVAGRPGVPAFRPDKAVPLSIGRQRALVHNAETLAHIALIARYGAGWFRQLGAVEAPGTCLVTVSGAVERPGVFEVETGTPISDIVHQAGPSTVVQAVLVGGYGGSWLPAAGLMTPFDPAALQAIGASMGAGVLAVLPTGACGLRETARVARFMAGQSAGQCGPCLFGLPALADDLGLIAAGRGDRVVFDRLLTRCGLVAGRGACKHPDGVAHLVGSALDVFAPDLGSHLRQMPCTGAGMPTVLPFPKRAEDKELKKS
jgi:NADH:ubiquinone oxidoreductase subunit F (NADH-binding)